MRRPLFTIAAASVLMAGVGLAYGQSTTSTTTTTWTNNEGTTMRDYSTSEHWQSYQEPTWHAQVGMEVPNSVTLHPLPSTIGVPHADEYSYSIINNQPVVVERTTRKVVHTWD